MLITLGGQEFVHFFQFSFLSFNFYIFFIFLVFLVFSLVFLVFFFQFSFWLVDLGRLNGNIAHPEHLRAVLRLAGSYF